ncbi:MAG: class I SAM-dependent methyltransferase [Pseudomonadota bacterium]
MSFKDYFSSVASDYSSYRPGYPPGLFDYLASEAPSKGLAWDCATGSGQAATMLADYFEQVTATDGSQAQLDSAEASDTIEYRQELAENSSLADHSVDLITVGQALHWFDLEAFEQEADRVLKPGGLLAVWSYAVLSSEPAIDRVIQRLYDDILGDFWTHERRMVEEGYGSVQFGFEELTAPEFAMRADWDLRHLAGYLSTWSAGKRYEETRGENPLLLVADELQRAWGDAARSVSIHWPLTLRVWRKTRD